MESFFQFFLHNVFYVKKKAEPENSIGKARTGVSIEIRKGFTVKVAEKPSEIQIE